MGCLNHWEVACLQNESVLCTRPALRSVDSSSEGLGGGGGVDGGGVARRPRALDLQPARPVPRPEAAVWWPNRAGKFAPPPPTLLWFRVRGARILLALQDRWGVDSFSHVHSPLSLLSKKKK